MPATSREPWIKVKIGITRSDKILGLPSDSARWGWLRVLAEAKVQRQMGVFGSRAQLVDLLGRHGRHLDDYLTAGLLHVAPLDCGECLPRHPEAKKDELVVHDFRKEQRDPTNADRQADWYASQATIPNGQPNASSNGVPNADPNGHLTRARNDGDGDSESSSLRSEGPADEGAKTRTPRQQVVDWLRQHDFGEPSGWAVKPFNEMVRVFGPGDLVTKFSSAHASGVRLTNELIRWVERAEPRSNGTAAPTRGRNRPTEEVDRAFKR